MIEQVLWMTATDITRALMFILLLTTISVGGLLLAQKARTFHREGLARLHMYETAQKKMPKRNSPIR